jgi:D-tyrosyl-tRNA(Tyr) deacylase
MIAVVQRVSSASVTAGGRITGSIAKGLLVLLGVEKGDTDEDIGYIVRKTAGLRIFENNGKMDLSVTDAGGAILVVSQFTLAGDARKGKRPDFARAAEAQEAKIMYDRCVEAFRGMGIITEVGEFGAHMMVDSSGDGPVTILLNSKRVY